MAQRILPGFRPSLTFTLAYLGVLVLIPLSACFMKASSLTWDQFWAAAWTERAKAAYGLTFGAALTAAAPPSAWTTMTDSECATMSCSSRAIRVRSAAATASIR